MPMNDDRPSDVTEYPVIRDAQGGPSEDGYALLVEASTAEGVPVRFAVPLSEMHHFVSFLLVSVGKISAFQTLHRLPDPATTTGPCRPIPATSIAIGEPEHGEGYLGISVGRAELLFSMPISAFEPVGRSMLLAGVRPSDKRPS